MSEPWAPPGAALGAPVVPPGTAVVPRIVFTIERTRFAALWAAHVRLALPIGAQPGAGWAAVQLGLAGIAALVALAIPSVRGVALPTGGVWLLTTALAVWAARRQHVAALWRAGMGSLDRGRFVFEVDGASFHHEGAGMGGTGTVDPRWRLTRTEDSLCVWFDRRVVLLVDGAAVEEGDLLGFAAALDGAIRARPPAIPAAGPELPAGAVVVTLRPSGLPRMVARLLLLSAHRLWFRLLLYVGVAILLGIFGSAPRSDRFAYVAAAVGIWLLQPLSVTRAGFNVWRAQGSGPQEVAVAKGRLYFRQTGVTADFGLEAVDRVESRMGEVWVRLGPLAVFLSRSLVVSGDFDAVVAAIDPVGPNDVWHVDP